jgi:hypothetical protein
LNLRPLPCEGAADLQNIKYLAASSMSFPGFSPVLRRGQRRANIRPRFKRGAMRARKKVRARKPPSTPVVETVVVDVVEEPIPGVTVVAEFEAAEVREASAGPAEPEESGSATPESEEP